ncbi:CBS domain-containing protein [Streptomyces sp. NPDC052301]|uniref:CBS domain-containing protein n=1 Tax=Streptomyces sp. NPDC052301 TaxID=3365687 RepID=UPI0037CD9708
MNGGAECIGEQESVLDAARKMRDLGVGALPICGGDNKLKGMLGAGEDPVSCPDGGLALGAATVGAADDVEEILRTRTAACP